MLRWYAHGLSTQEIAHRVGVTPPTIEFHLRSMCQKLGTTNAELIAAAKRYKLL